MLIAPRSHDSIYFLEFEEGDTVQRRDDDEKCVIVCTLGDWLWLNPVDCSDATPFTGRTCDYHVVKSDEPPRSRQ